MYILLLLILYIFKIIININILFIILNYIRAVEKTVILKVIKI